MAGQEREENFAKVIDFPKEVRVYGHVSQVYFQGKDKQTTLIIDQSNESPSGSYPKRGKSSKEPVLIVPVKQENSEIRFVKLPLQKMSKHPKGEKSGDSACPRINLNNEEPTMEKVVEFRAKTSEFSKKSGNLKRTNEFDTCFVFQESEPFQKEMLPTSILPIADLFRFQEKPKPELVKVEEPEVKPEVKPPVKPPVEPPRRVLEKKPSVRDAETNTVEIERLMKFLVSSQKRKKSTQS